MKKPGKKELMQAASYVLCIAVAWTQADRVDGSEFPGGRITGPIFALFEGGMLLFVLAIVLTFLPFMYRRVAALMGIAACMLCFPLYLYFTAPGPFRSAFRGVYSVPLQSSFVWDYGMLAGMLTLAIAVFISVHGISATRRQRDADAHK